MIHILHSNHQESDESLSQNVVYLDALIPREDFAVEVSPAPATGTEKISIIHIEGPFFGPDLRKPDFQRETNNWSPAKIVALIKAFVDSDLIPAVILWKSGNYLFVVDGAHRLSALLAWVHDDYGDKERSLAYFGGHISPDQRKIAERTREMVKKDVGAYVDYKAARQFPAQASPLMTTRLHNLSNTAIIAQWVPATDRQSAEESFFKINQSATPIDATERRILKARKSASAVSARAITHAGTGHKYWSDFDPSVQEEIEKIGAAIYHALYDPPLDSNAVSTLDVPVAGRGYNALPFIFDLVNEANGVDVADTTAKQDVKDALVDDPDGQQTLKYLRLVQKRTNRVTGDMASSLGLHPVIYFYTRSGTFQPTAFLAVSRFVEDLSKRNQLKKFLEVRKQFEDFLIEHKEAMSLLVHKFGSGGRSLPWLHKYYALVLEGLCESKSLIEIQAAFAANPDFTFLTVPRPAGVRDAPSGAKRVFNSGTKTAAFFAAALPNGTRCALCHSLVHKNSMHIDHIKRASENGAGDVSNAQVTHPCCDSVKG